MQRERRRRFAPLPWPGSPTPFLLLATVALGGLLVQTLLFEHYPAAAAAKHLARPQHAIGDLLYHQPCDCGHLKTPASTPVPPSTFGAHLNYSLSFPVYYINMDKSTARRERMELDFGRLWDLRRSPAVDGGNETQVLALMGRDHYDRILPYVTEDRGPNTINRAELGCVLSHLATIRRAYVEGHATAMIVEDDITPLLMPFWIASIQDLVHEAQGLDAFDGQPWGLVQLAWIWGLNEDLYDRIEERHGQGHQLVRVRFQFGTSAYIMSRAGMEKVVDAFFLDRSPQGLIRLQEGGRQAELYVAAASNVLVTVPSLFTIEGSDTTISTGEEEQRRLSSHRESNNIHTKAMFDLYHAAVKKEKAMS